MSSYEDHILQMRRAVFQYKASNTPDPFQAFWSEIQRFYSNYQHQSMFKPSLVLPTPKEPSISTQAPIKVEAGIKLEPNIENEVNLKVKVEPGFLPDTNDSGQDETSSTTASQNNTQVGKSKQSKSTVKSGQSQYKNKLKEPLERAKVILKDLCKFTPARFVVVQEETRKSDETWLADSEKIKGDVSRLENEENGDCGPKLKSLKRTVLQKIVDKKYCYFSGLFQFKQQLMEIMKESDVIQNFKEHKDRISHVYFKRTEFEKEEDLFSWILLVNIGALILPKDQNKIEMLPLTKETIYFNYWLIESPMKPQNKELYRKHNIRDHLRGVLLEASTNLIEQACRRFSTEKLGLLKQMLRTIHVESAMLADVQENLIIKTEDIGHHKPLINTDINAKRLYDEIKIETDFESEKGVQKIVCKEENK